MDCALAESFYGLNDNIEAFADVEKHEIEKPFLQPHEQTRKESFSCEVLELEMFIVIILDDVSFLRTFRRSQ